jgi:type IV pilus assembly protein PilV
MNAYRETGVTLIEVLVAMIVTVIGLLGMVAVQMRAYANEAESYQRAQAAVLLEDIANRIRANRKNAANYVATDIGVGESQSCEGAASLAAKDLCEWANLLRGAAEAAGGNNVGAMTSGRACISSPSPNVFSVTIAWEGNVPSTAPSTACGKDAFTDENLRRALSSVVRIPNLGS